MHRKWIHCHFPYPVIFSKNKGLTIRNVVKAARDMSAGNRRSAMDFNGLLTFTDVNCDFDSNPIPALSVWMGIWIRLDAVWKFCILQCIHLGIGRTIAMLQYLPTKWKHYLSFTTWVCVILFGGGGWANYEPFLPPPRTMSLIHAPMDHKPPHLLPDHEPPDPRPLPPWAIQHTPPKHEPPDSLPSSPATDHELPVWSRMISKETWIWTDHGRCAS